MSGLSRNTGVDPGGSLQWPPQQRAPVIRPWLQRSFIEQAVIACRQCIVHDDLNAGSCQPPELIEIAERIQEGRGPRVSTARGGRGFREPDRLSRLEIFSDPPIESQRPVPPR